jgi:hypothetical protein
LVIGTLVIFRFVSIPSRRVGDTQSHLIPYKHLMFPSPQGGSETPMPSARKFSERLFPCPQGGSETDALVRAVGQNDGVSIPSRRVGD